MIEEASSRRPLSAVTATDSPATSSGKGREIGVLSRLGSHWKLGEQLCLVKKQKMERKKKKKKKPTLAPQRVFLERPAQTHASLELPSALDPETRRGAAVEEQAWIICWSRGVRDPDRRDRALGQAALPCTVRAAKWTITLVWSGLRTWRR